MEHKVVTPESVKRYQAKNKEQIAIKRKERDQKNKERVKARMKEWERKNREKRLVYKKELRLKRKIEILSHYSGGTPVCKCCGETITSFLTLDHIDGNGADHRRATLGSNKRAGSTAQYQWIVNNNYPPIYQVMCFNCNTGRHINGGICPHQQKEIRDEIEKG